MPFPRRPRDESPAVTIRWQRRQMAQMEQTIQGLRIGISHRDEEMERRNSDIASLGSRLSRVLNHLELVESEYAGFRTQAADRAERLAYLEGYHAKSQETAVQQTPVLATGGDIFGHQSQAHAPRGPRNPQGLQDGRQAAESAGFDPGAAGFGETAGDQIPSERADYRSYPGKRSVEHVEITANEGDGLTKWVGW